MAPMIAVVILDSMVTDFIVPMPMNVLTKFPHVIQTQVVKILMVHLFANVKLVSSVMALLAMHLTIALSSMRIMVCGNVLMDSLVMNLIVRISTNVMTHHVQPMQHAQTRWDHFIAHVTMVIRVMDSSAVI
jgi:hypothetical protein